MAAASVVWECSLRGDRLATTIRALEQWLRANIREFETEPPKPQDARAVEAGEH